MDIADVMNEIKSLREDIRELRRELADFRSSYEHHKAASQVSSSRSAIDEPTARSTPRSPRVRATVSGGIKAMSRDLAKVDTRVGIARRPNTAAHSREPSQGSPSW